MEKNKSIDGLSPRRPKKTTAKKAPVKQSVSKTPKKIPVKQPAKKLAIEEPVIEENPEISKEEAIEDFLKPVQAFDFDEQSGELKASDKPTKKEKKMKEKKKKSKAKKIIITIIIVLVLVIAGFLTWAVLWGNDIIAKITGGRGNVFDLIKIVEPTYEPLKTGSNGRTNILAFGTSGYNMEGDEGNGVHAGAQLTDSIMVISLNQDTGDIVMLSLPRDLKASPTCTATGKINEVYWCNNRYGDDEEAGAAALMNEVGSILGLDFQYYAHLNWGSLIQIVDTLGGIKITLDEGIYDYYWTGAVYDPGVEYEINGEAALGLARARHGTTGGDFSRGASQQKILIGIKNKLLEKNLSITDYLSLASALGDNLRSNFSVDELKTLAHLTFSFDFDSMRQVSLLDYSNGIRYMTTGNINGISYVLPSAGVGNYTKIQDYVAKMFSNDPRTYEEPSILVLNGDIEAVGVASNEKTKLVDEGYLYVDADNAPEGEYTEGYTLYALTNKPGTKAMLEKYYNLTAKTADEVPEGVSKDYDFLIIIGGEKKEE